MLSVFCSEIQKSQLVPVSSEFHRRQGEIISKKAYGGKDVSDKLESSRTLGKWMIYWLSSSGLGNTVSKIKN